MSASISAEREGPAPSTRAQQPRRRLRRLFVTAALISGPIVPGARADAQAQSTTDASSAVTNTLVGVVVDVIGQPMDRVEVYIAGTNHATLSDARGRWRFVDPPTGPHVVVARRIGYVPFVREVVVTSRANDTLSLLLRRFPATLSPVEVRARTLAATSDADIVAERLTQIRVGAGRLFTRNEILRMRPQSIAELIYGIPGIAVARGQNDIVVTTTRSGVGVMNVQGQACQLQFYLDNTPIANEGVPALDPMTFRSVEVYPQAVILTGLATRPDRCGAIVINTTKR